MNALEWLKERQRKSLENQAIFNSPIENPFEQTAHGFKARNYKQPEVKNKLVQKRGDLTMTKEWVDNARFQKDSPGINITPTPQRSRARGIPLPPNVYKRGFQPSPAREVSSGWLDRMIRSGNAPVAQDTRPSPQTIRGVASGYARQPRPITPEVVRASEGPSMEVLPGESIEEARLRIFGRGSPESPARETWGGDLNLTLPQHPRTRRWIQDPSTILNMGNLIKGMGRTFQGVDDRLERNRIRRLMEYRTANPYYRGGLY